MIINIKIKNKNLGSEIVVAHIPRGVLVNILLTLK
jgi:hypothetical protein